MPVLFKNNATALLAASISSSTTTIVISAGLGASFPSPVGGSFFYATLFDSVGNYEIVKVTAKSVDSFTVVRGQDNTTALAFAAGDGISMRPNAATFENMIQRDGGVPFTGNINAGGNKLNNLDTPSVGSDGTNKSYVDAVVATEASSRSSADTTLQSNINTEASTRASADTTLQNNINAEAAARAAADTAETNARVAADNSLSAGKANTGGNNASGTWPISITGNAGGNASTASWVYCENVGGDGAAGYHVDGWNFNGPNLVNARATTNCNCNCNCG